MSLSNLTRGGWIVFALALLCDLDLIIGVVAACTGTPVNGEKVISIDVLSAVVFTTWLLWLVTP